MGDTLVAVDTGPVVLDSFIMSFGTAALLAVEIHGVKVMAVTTLPGVGILHRPPDIFRQMQALLLELLRGVHFSGYEVVVKFVAGLDLTYYLVDPWPRNMAIRTGCANTGSIGEVNVSSNSR